MRRVVKNKRYWDEYRFVMNSIYWAHIGALYRKRTTAPTDPTPITKYNIYADALNGDDTNSGLFETVPVRTLHRAGNVMRGLPSDRETLGVTIHLWGSDPAQVGTHYTDFNDILDDAGVPKSSYIGMNNYQFISNPNSGARAILNGVAYDKNDPRRVAIYNANSTHHYRPVFLYLEGNNITMRGIEMINFPGSAMRHAGNASLFRELVVHDGVSDSLFHSGNDTIFEYNHMYNIQENLTGGLTGDGIRMQYAHRPVIRYNVVHNVSSEGYNFDDGCVDGLMYLNDAYEIGFPNGFGAATQPPNRTGNAYKLSASIQKFQTNRNAAIGNRGWRNLRDFFAVDRSNQMILFNASRLAQQYPYVITGDSKILISNNILAEADTVGLFTLEGGTLYPRERYNSWNDTTTRNNDTNMNMNLSASLPADIWKDVTLPNPALTGFQGTHVLPLEARFANITPWGAGFGKHVGPVNDIIAQLRSMTPQQIRDRLALHR